MFEKYGYAQTMRHCVIENPGRFGPVSFRPGRYSLGLLLTSEQGQHLRLLSDIVLQKFTLYRMLYQCAGAWFVWSIIKVDRFILGRSPCPRDVSDWLKELVKQIVVQFNNY